MGFIDDANETAETAARKAKDAFEDTTDRIGDKIDEAKADAEVKRTRAEADAEVEKAEAERDAVKTRNEVKEDIRDA